MSRDINYKITITWCTSHDSRVICEIFLFDWVKKRHARLTYDDRWVLLYNQRKPIFHRLIIYLYIIVSFHINTRLKEQKSGIISLPKFFKLLKGWINNLHFHYMFLFKTNIKLTGEDVNGDCCHSVKYIMYTSSV